MSFHPNPASSESGSSSAPTTAGATTAWRNSLKQDFVRVPGTATQFSVWKTRVADFAAFVADHAVNEGYDYRRGCAPEILRADGYKNRGWDFGWNNPGFPQDRDHPVACVDWEDARSFCRWLTAREHRGGTLPGDRCYRLPTDSEWSCAVGLGGIEGPGTPRQKSRQIEGVFPWGTAWPPPPGSGNYCGEECAGSDLPAGWTLLAGYRDSFPFTSP
ncbi:MAG: hypothetical protein FJ399_13620, partial [Verrucomicrobia bacterium]|nr:hypothetical protein [Verrucomicrobiota bacterium]